MEQAAVPIHKVVHAGRVVWPTPRRLSESPVFFSSLPLSSLSSLHSLASHTHTHTAQLSEVLVPCFRGGEKRSEQGGVGVCAREESELHRHRFFFSSDPTDRRFTSGTDLTGSD